ncbi:hypothetical protein GCM10010372_66580 [Streptomyces tauricus]|uniref:DUF5999 family protein n=1 Tax=Streptomyces tauricus TaxID=68274 RepID=UPI001678750A|nr:DUF5999 family protein [Streptomyces tauricus]GHA57375.1 hypothetical protein GCM10010372_66580 [Streptomyces tauricus]
MCSHQSSCPSAARSDRSDGAHRSDAHIVSAHPEQGWYLLCDGAIVFDDTGALLPDGRVVAPHRVPVEQLAIAA